MTPSKRLILFSRRSYVANAVNFDGSAAYLTRGGELTGLADGKTFTFSVWAGNLSGDLLTRRFFNTTNTRFTTQISNTNKLAIVARNSANSVILNYTTTQTFSAAGAYNHFLLSVDLAASSLQLYINDVVVTAFDGATSVDDAVDFTNTEFAIGANTDGTGKFAGNMSEFWLNSGSLDLSTAANRRKFISAAGKPVNLGTDGSVPTGAAPVVYLGGAGSGWATNKGSGGGFTINGSLAAAASPSS